MDMAQADWYKEAKGNAIANRSQLLCVEVCEFLVIKSIRLIANVINVINAMYNPKAYFFSIPRIF